MATYRVGPLVNNDLRTIGHYTQRHWGKTQRKKYLAQIVNRFQQLAKHPHSGKTCDEVRAGYRKYLEGRHIIFYRIADDGIVEIVRVLHGRMDYQQHLVS